MKKTTVSAWRVTGYRKKETGSACEDAFAAHPFSRGTVLAAADGHGDARCKYADRGARLACEVSARVLARYAESVGRRSASEFLNARRGDIAREITLGFRHAVLDDFIALHPEHASALETLHGEIDKSFERETLVLGGDDGARRAREKRKEQLSQIAYLYGTTLRASILTERYVFSLAVGDGDTVALLENGECVWLLPKGEAFDTRTESMCEDPRELADAFYFSFLPLAGKRGGEDAYTLGALFLSTDGLRNSFFSDDGYTAFLTRSAARMTEKDKKTFSRSLRRRLETLTRDSCYGDDITLLIGTLEE